MARRKSTDAVAIERIENEDNNRQIDERENQSGVNGENGAATS
jgi:hypothetical protein